MIPLERRAFRLVHGSEPGRVVRGMVDAPIEREESLPHVILLHGFKGFMDWGFFPDIARRIAQRGFVVVRYNTSGSGIGDDLESFTELEAFARNTLSRDIEDYGKVRAWLREGNVPGLDPDRLSLIGHSRGGGLALIQAAERGDCRCVVTWAAVASFDRFGDEAKVLWRERGSLPILNARTGQELRLNVSALDDLEQHRALFDVPAACRKIESAVLLIHGTADESVSFQEFEILRDSIDRRLLRTLEVEGAGHTFGVRHPMTASTDAWERVAGATLDMLREHG